MTRITHAIAAGLVLAMCAAPAAAQTPVRFSVVGGLSLPIGDLGNNTDLGLNLALRGEGRPVAPNWGVRGDVTYDHYAGHGTVDEYSYLAFAANLVHHETRQRMYEFGGLGVYNSKVGFRNALDRSETSLGMQLGAGFELTADRRVFTEFGLTGAFTSGRSSVWFPVRVGLRF
jgi:hypothetical protein